MGSYYASDCHAISVTKLLLKKGLYYFIALFLVGGFTIETMAQNPEPDTELYEQLKLSGDLDLGYETIDSDTECPDVHLLIQESEERDDCYIAHDPATWTNFPGNDDGSTSLISLPFTFDLYGTTYSSLYINNNGNITFDNPVSSYTPDGFPISTPMIAPFWGDVDTRGESGEVWYIVTDHSLYVNWVEVGPFNYTNYDDTVISTFQLIITDGTDPVLDPGNNVAFYYQDMGWTTGDASDGVDGFGGSPATVGINSGNGVDFVQIGRFGLDNDDYDGPEGDTDGVHWLDDQCFEFNVSDAENFPPVAQNFPSDNTIGMCSDESITLEFGFIGPEGDQTVSISVDDNGAPGLIVNSNTSGNPGLVNVTITPGMSGDFTYTFTATDDFSPAGITVIDLLVNVDNCGTEGCTDSEACNFDSGATIDNGSCDYNCYGCIEVEACNYDANATMDNGTCEYDSCVGCMESDACNFDSTATIENGTCEYSCYGCMFSFACNYDITATIDDGSCSYPGCTDSNAINYNAIAGCDDGSCYYDNDDCTIVCPDDITIECGDSTEPMNTGELSLLGICDGVEIGFSDVVEGNDCLTTITRTWIVYIPGTPEMTCVQTITVADTEGPIFSETPADITVDCIEDIPLPAECIAEDACTSVVDIDVFTSETGNPTDSCILTTAFGPGDDWAIWMPVLEVDGLAPSANWLFDGDAYFIMYDDGTAHLYGSIYNDVNNDLTFDVDLWFENGMGWLAWEALGRNYKDDLNLVTDEYEDWTYYEMANIFSHLTGTGILAGSELYLSHMPSNFYYGFQCGDKANNKNGNTGMSGWFTYSGTFNGESVDGNGDINVDKECVPYTLSECINNDEFTYMWHATDECGNVSFATQVITVDDNIAPEFTVVPEDITIECDEWPIPVPTDIEAIDNCDSGVFEINYMGEFTGEGDDCEYTILRRWDAIDVCDNIATYFQTITIVDTTAPEFTFVPEDATYECDETIPFIDAEAEDVCQETVTITYEDVTGEGDCPQAYTIYRTFYANDGCENIAEAVQVITVVDTTAPVFDPYEVQVFVDCQDIDSVEELTATDNCDEEVDVTYTEILQSGGCLGVLVRTYTATDDCGNEATAEQYITLQDFEAPVIENPADMTIECDEVGDLIDPETITITDNCSEFTVEFSETIIDGPCEDTYTIVWHWVAIDYCDNMSEATTTINVQDTTAPELIGVPEDMDLSCNDDIPDAIVTAIDNCDDELVVSVTATTEELDCGSIFTRTWCVSDDCGNETCATQIINIYDDEAPVFTYVPANITVECDEDIPYEDAIAEDNCSDFEITYTDTESEGDCPQAYFIERCYTAIDACGNSETACQTISVVDTTAPVITAEVDIDRPCDDYGDIYATAEDNCGAIVEFWYEENFMSGGCVGTLVRTYYAEDECGNVGEYIQIIHLIDDVTPWFVDFPADVTVECDEVPSADIEINYDDNCTEVTLIYDGEEITDGICEDSYTITRTWTITDNCFNTISATWTIIVQDTTNPEWIEDTLPQDETVECSDELPEIVYPEAFDNCDQDVNVEFTEEIFAGDCPQEMEIQWIFRAFDNCGNMAIYVQHIYVVDTTAPILDEVEDLTFECDEMITEDLPNATDNCGEVTVWLEDGEMMEGECPQEYSFTRTYYAEDECGNVADTSITIYVVDTTDPEFVGLPLEIDMPCDDITEPEGIEVYDNCGIPTWTWFDESSEEGCAGSIIRTFVVTDACGNSSTEVQTITLIDNVAPEFTAFPADITVECNAVPEPQTSEIDYSDNCTEVILNYDGEERTDGDCEYNYTLLRTWTITDNCDNSTSMVQTITVQDTTAPELFGVPEDMELNCNDEIPDAIVSAEDNCSDDLVVNVTANTEALDCGWIFTRTWCVMDDCGNETCATQIINIYDDEAPVFTYVPADVTVECSEEIPFEDAMAEDNCSEFEITFEDTETELSGLECGQFRTQTPGGWGAPANGNNPGVYRDANFDNAFPNGLVVGCDYTLTLTSAQAVQDFLPSGGTPAAISQNYIDPDGLGNTLAGHLTAITLSIGFDAYDADFSDAEVSLSNLIVNNGTFQGWTVGEVVAEANQIFGGCSSAYSASEITNVLDMINQNYVDGTQDNQNLDCEGEELCGYYITRVFTATDDCGNESSAVQIIAVIDTTAPVADEYEISIDLPCDDFDGVYITATDNCSEVTITYEDSPMSGGCEGSYTRSYTLTDECGNQSFEMQIIHLYDNTAPEVVSTPVDITIECDETLPTDEAVFTDNCDDDLVVTLTSETTVFDCGSTIVQTWTAVDNCLNETSTSRTITLEDTTAPIISGEDYDTIVECDMAFDLPEITATDNCDENLDLVMTMETIAGGCTNEWTEIYTWTASDNCDNMSQRVITVHYEDTTDPMFIFVPESDEVSCDEAVPSVQAEATDNCGEVTITFEDVIIDGECAYAYTIQRTWTATDECENYSTALTEYYIYDSTAPVLEGDFADVNVECADEVPAFDDWTATDNCDSDPMVETNWDFISEDDCGNYVAIVTCTATDACGNSSSTSFNVTVSDQTNPVLLDVPEDLILDCDDDIPSSEDCIATDNCDDDVDVSFSEEIIGDLPDPEATSDCNTLSPEVLFGDVDWGMWLEGLGDMYEHHQIIDGEFQEYPNGTAHFSATLVSVSNENAGFYVNAWFYNGMNWDDWSTQVFPTSYKDDLGLCPDAYLDWTYYLMDNTQSNLIGWGDYAGSFITLEHAPANNYYGFQVGTCANNVNTSYGAGGWFFYEGLFVDSSNDISEEVWGAGDFAWDSDCCPDYIIERTWCATDCSDNFVCETQTITFEDLDGIVGPEPVSLILNDIEVKDDFGFTAIAPNPAFYRTTIEFKTNKVNRVKLELYDGMGKKVKDLYEENVEANEFYRVDLNTQELKAGIYTLRLSSSSYSATKQVVVVR